MADLPTARDRPGPGAVAGGIAILLVLAVAAVLTGDPVLVLATVLSPLYIVHTLFVLGAAFEREDARPTDLEAPDDWPRYTILAPLHKEAAVAANLVASLDAINYPADRRQVLFLVEADDGPTAEALASSGLPAGFEIVIVPPGGPRTKPNALNHGLALATGSFLTVYDAEDIPDPDQLKDAARQFLRSPDDVVCLQARLAIDNTADGWLALMMTIEYAALFDATKCGFAAMAMPVALGGTSNHFRGIR